MAINGGNQNRQKMINLMYIVFIAMLALNVSSDVVDGFVKVEQGLKKTTQVTQTQNSQLLREMAQAQEANPDKVSQWSQLSQTITYRADSLCSFIQSLKQSIAESTDGKQANVEAIERKDYVGASDEVMLSPVNGRGNMLKSALGNFAGMVKEIIGDDAQVKSLLSLIETNDSPSGLSWEQDHFENIPTMAAITLLTKMQGDVRHIQGYVLSQLLNRIDAGDYRVNELTAQVIPDSRIVMRGGQYRANIVLGSVDTTQRPLIVVGGTALSEDARGVYTTTPTSVGTHKLQGYIETVGRDTQKKQYPFVSEYTVVEPMATVAPVLMNVLYAGIDNKVNIAVPGVPMSDISATMSGGQLVRSGNVWIARPTKVDSEVTIAVSAKMSDGRTIGVGQSKLRVRALPDPMPYVAYNDEQGHTKRFKGGRLSKQALLSAGGIRAAIDDSFLDVAYTVLKFQIVHFDSMGNALPEVSNSSQFSERQIAQIKALGRGKRLYITEVIARGPDGVERKIPSIEIILI